MHFGNLLPGLGTDESFAPRDPPPTHAQAPGASGAAPARNAWLMALLRRSRQRVGTLLSRRPGG